MDDGAVESGRLAHDFTIEMRREKEPGVLEPTIWGVDNTVPLTREGSDASNSRLFADVKYHMDHIAGGVNEKYGNAVCDIEIMKNTDGTLAKVIMTVHPAEPASTVETAPSVIGDLNTSLAEAFSYIEKLITQAEKSGHLDNAFGVSMKAGDKVGMHGVTRFHHPDIQSMMTAVKTLADELQGSSRYDRASVHVNRGVYIPGKDTLTSITIYMS